MDLHIFTKLIRKRSENTKKWGKRFGQSNILRNSQEISYQFRYINETYQSMRPVNVKIPRP